MESPQMENGHLDIANELVEKFAMTYLSANEWRILWVVLRKTWAWHKKEDKISLTQFQHMSGLSRPSVRKAIAKLVAKGLLVAVGGTFIHVYSFNKHYSQWTSSGRATSSHMGHRVVAVGGTKLVAVGSPTKETKETITKENRYRELTNLQEKDFEEIAEKYHVPIAFVKSKFDDMEIWAGSMPDNKKIKGRNWRLTLMGFVKKDALQIRKEASTHESKRGIDARNIT